MLWYVLKVQSNREKTIRDRASALKDQQLNPEDALAALEARARETRELAGHLARAAQHGPGQRLEARRLALGLGHQALDVGVGDAEARRAGAMPRCSPECWCGILCWWRF